MGKQNASDRRRVAVRHFIDTYRQCLARQGTIASTWRRKGDRKLGPYFLLVVRDSAGRQRSVYLGPASELVEEIRRELAELQRPYRGCQALLASGRSMRRAIPRLRELHRQKLAKAGLRPKGVELRGWSTLTAANVRELLRPADDSPASESSEFPAAPSQPTTSQTTPYGY
jgi:hypothetical protein